MLLSKKYGSKAYPASASSYGFATPVRPVLPASPACSSCYDNSGKAGLAKEHARKSCGGSHSLASAASAREAITAYPKVAVQAVLGALEGLGMVHAERQ